MAGLQRIDDDALNDLRRCDDEALNDFALDEDCLNEAAETARQTGFATKSGCSAHSTVWNRRANREELTALHRRGSHSRADCAKPKSHAEQGWSHFQLADSYAIGRPCTAACRYERACGANFPPHLFMAAHEVSYGRQTKREQLRTGDFRHTVEFSKSYTLRKWRELAASAMSWSLIDRPPKRVEMLTVCDFGPVCADFWRAAYGIPKGTANTILAQARSGALRVDMAEGTGAIMRSLSSRPDVDQAAQVTIQWWETWLELEDQMPNEAAIQHRTVVWQSVYDLEYVADVEWWGISRTLSRSRWVSLRKVALANLSIDYFGHKEGDPTRPLVKLSLVQRPKHSNFGSCKWCSRAKEAWMKYRR